MSQAAPHLSTSVSQQLGLVEQQHQALLSALKITQSIEQLQTGLEAALLLGQPSAQITAKAMQTFAALSEKTRVMTNQQLQCALVQLDKQISEKIHVVLDIAKSDDFANMEKLFNGETDNQLINKKLGAVLQEFRKKAQTAVALRILLQKRGISSSPLRHNVAEADIEQELQVIEQKEQRCRKQVQREISELKRDLTALVNRSDVSEQTRLAAAHIQQDLDRDLEHIQAGKPFSDLPSAVEVIELCAEPHLTPDSDEKQRDEAKPEAVAPARKSELGSPHPATIATGPEKTNSAKFPVVEDRITKDNAAPNRMQAHRKGCAEKHTEEPKRGWFGRLIALFFRTGRSGQE